LADTGWLSLRIRLSCSFVLDVEDHETLQEEEDDDENKKEKEER
jgi:hypothetical protein